MAFVSAAMFLRSCVGLALSCGNGSSHSLHASKSFSEYNKDLISSFLTLHMQGGENNNFVLTLLGR